MIIRYFRYYFEASKDGKKESEPLAGLLDAYSSHGCNTFKSSFLHNGETIFLLKERNKHYLFLKTKDTEIIKTINRRDLKVEEIATRLMNNESIGFASYVYVDDRFIGFVSTQLAPTVSAFGSFINSILHRIDLKSHKLAISPLVSQITRIEAKKMSFIGTSSIKLNSSSSMFRDVGSVLGVYGENIHDLDSFEITIRPKPNKSLNSHIDTLIDLPPNGIERFQIRAKAELHDRMTDYRIESSLIMRNLVKIKEGEDVFTSIEKTVQESISAVIEKVKEYDESNQVENMSVGGISQYYTHSRWPSIVANPESPN